MVRQRVTLMDVAARAGVSRTTASFVMTGRRDMRISSAAEQRVLQAARELDYRPNLLARSLRTNLSQTIGLISDVVATEPFAGHLIRSSMTTALLHDHLLFVGESEGDPAVEEQLVRSMLDRGVGGFLYASSSTRVVEVSALFESQRLVLLNCLARGDDVTAVVPDEEGGGRLAATTLLDAGHRDGIVLVGETLDHVVAGRDRRRGIEAALADAGAGLAGEVATTWWPEPTFAAMSRMLAAGHRPTAIVCLNDRVALGVYQALADAGLSVPGDVSVISFDDSDLAGWVRPGLTSVALPHLEMGRRATELLMAPAGSPVVHRIEMPLVSRESVGPPR
ncbi:LacI family DNA-binding transcriptional regulator [Nakamurella deserti]|uniref:LacI family DNA-binding transcriptional regulator n=1 Tax=Nakamurella deserti TaxID=2164074 RepID=UPI001F0BC621|nr:LacI family DNA-binding transcriptional regulator [Nakamurella deserti]